MFRKAAIVLALAASFLGAQAMDLPKPVRELTHKNKTKATKPNSGVKSKAKTAQLCLVGEGSDLAPFDTNGATLPDPTSYLYTAHMSVYNCADVSSAGVPVNNPTPIGRLATTCAWAVAGQDLAPCTAQVTLNTEWHKTTKTSSLAISYWADITDLLANQLVTVVDPAVTSATGAFGKVDNIQSLALAPYAGSTTSYKLTLGYKGRGWNPAAY